MTADQEHLKCGTYSKYKNGCTIHFIRTIVLKEIILGELNKMISFVKENEDEFVQAAMDNFIQVVQKYEHITELTPEIMHELIEKIVVHAPDKSSGHRTQEIEIHYRFNVAVTTAVADSMKYDKKRKIA